MIINKVNLKWQLVVFGFISLQIGLMINTHLDEFILFADLAYRNPNFYLNQFPNGYHAYVKLLPFDLKLNLPYAYLGNIQGYLFYPFYRLFPIELAKFTYSFVSLVLIFWLIKSTFNLQGSKLWILMFLVPLYITILHDSGPVNISIICFFVSKSLIFKLYNSQSIRVIAIYCILITILWFVAFYDKMFFLYLFPSVLIFSITGLTREKIFSVRSISLLIPIFIFVSFVFLYLNGKSQIQGYINGELSTQAVQTKMLLGGSQDITLLVNFLRYFPDSIHTWSGLNGFFHERLQTLATIVNSFDFSFYLIRNLNPKNFKFISLGFNFSLTSILFILIFLVNSVKYLVKVISRGIYSTEIKPILYFISFFSILFMFLILGKVRSPHHFVFIWVPLLGLLFDNTFNFSRNFLFVIYFILNVGLCLLNLITSEPEEHILDNYQSIINYTKRDDSKMHIINFDSWSHSFTRMIDNPNNHLVTWIDLRDDRQLNRLIELSDSLHLPIIEVSNRLDWGHEDEALTPDQRMNYFKSKGLRFKKLINPLIFQYF